MGLGYKTKWQKLKGIFFEKVSPPPQKKTQYNQPDFESTDSKWDTSWGCHPPTGTHGHCSSVTGTENLVARVALRLTGFIYEICPLLSQLL